MVAESVPSPPAVAAAAPRVRRDDIQGLRAVASLLVATFHIWFGTISGGVDLFFVVGGFLLATTLIGELERHRRIRIGGYLRRTVSRLFPLAGLVLIVVAVTLLITGPLLAFRRNAGDIFAAATYWENWRLAGDATDYVAAGHAKSAVQHFWAMSVQGQITLVLLTVFVLAGWAARRLAWSPRRLLAIVLAVVTVGSFAYAQVMLPVNPESTYFDTWARLWEFGVGGLAALVLIRWAPAVPARARALLAGLGLLLVLTAGLLPQDWPYPGTIALWPVTGAVLILVAGAAGPTAGAGSILAWRPLVWLGGLSYGLYLWSWPVLKAYLDLFPARAQTGVPLLDGIGLLLVSVLLSWASTRALSFLARRRALSFLARRRAATVPDSPPLTDPGVDAAPTGPPVRVRTGPRLVTAVTVPIIAAASLYGVIIGPQVHEQALAALASQESIADPALLRAAIRSSLEDPVVPNGQFLIGWEAVGPEWSVDGCLTVTADNVLSCRYGPDEADRELWVVGDSQVVTWASGIRDGLREDVALQLMGRSMCPFTQGRTLEHMGPELQTECETHNRWVLDEAAARRPDVVVVTYGSWWVGDWYDMGYPVGTELAQGSAPLIRELQELGTQVVWLDAVPPSRKLEDCMGATTVEQTRLDCETEFGPDFRDRSAQLAEGMTSEQVLVVPTLAWFCDEEQLRCPAVTAGVPVHADQTHIGLAYSTFLAAVLNSELLQPLDLGH